MSSKFPRQRRPSELEQSLEKGYNSKKEKALSQSNSDDQRTPFERDRDRLLYSREFRRLKDVTQVARSGESYLYHDRLTHSLKVAQVGRRLAELLEDYYESEFENLKQYLKPDVVEAACLAHDIGHPPFGHVSEDILDEKVRQKSKQKNSLERIATTDNDQNQGFEGNAQSFRTVTQLGSHRPGTNGLDLTRATLNAMQKYPWGRGSESNTEKNTDNKWGYYPTESGYFQFARAGTDDSRGQVLEAEIMDYADDLTYAIHDVEDFYRSGLIPLDQIVRQTDKLLGELPEDFDEDEDDIEDYRNCFMKVAENNNLEIYTFGQYIDSETDVDADVGDVLMFFVRLIFGFAPVPEEFRSPYQGTQKERKVLNQFVSSMIGTYLDATESDPSNRELVTLSNDQDDGCPTLRIDDEFKRHIGILKHLTFYYVISNPTLAAQQHGQIDVIDKLFEVLYDEADPESIESSAILEPFRERIRNIDGNNGPPRARIVADMIASMTETQAVEMYNRMVGSRPGSLQDEIMRQ